MCLEIWSLNGQVCVIAATLLSSSTSPSHFAGVTFTFCMNSLIATLVTSAIWSCTDSVNYRCREVDVGERTSTFWEVILSGELVSTVSDILRLFEVIWFIKTWLDMLLWCLLGLMNSASTTTCELLCWRRWMHWGAAVHGCNAGFYTCFVSSNC